MTFRIVLTALAFALCASVQVASAQTSTLTLRAALQRAEAGNPRIAIAGREIGVATGKKIQAGVIPNPELSFELDNAFGSGDYRGLRSAETTLQLSQAIELGGKREARVAAGAAELQSARWQYEAIRLEVLSETAVAFFQVLSEQRKVQILDGQVASLDRVVPALQRRVDAGASSPGEIARITLAIDLVRVDRERARTNLAVNRRELAILMGRSTVDFHQVSGDFNRVGNPPAFPALIRALERHPQLTRWTAVRAQRDAELLTARLKPIPDLRVGLAWRHYRDTGDNAARLNAAIAIPVWDQNLGGIVEAQANRDKAEAELAANKAALLLLLAKAYDTLNGSLRELELIRASAIPNAERAIETIESGYGQGRYSLLELLDVRTSAMQATLREQEALANFHNAVATIEGLAGIPVPLRARGRK